MALVPTAQAILDTKASTVNSQYETYHPDEVIKAMKQFAQLHVAAALKEAAKKARLKTLVLSSMIGAPFTQVVNEESILAAYPTSKIK